MALCTKCFLPDCLGPLAETHVVVQMNEDQCINGTLYRNGTLVCMPARINGAHSSGAHSVGGPAKRTIKNSNA